MIKRKGFKFVSGLALAGSIGAVAISSGGCSAVNTIAQAAQGCDEFSQGATAVASLQIDGDTKAFIAAGQAVVNVTAKMEGSVLTACEGIATDMGVTDTWTAMGPTAMGGSLDNEVTEACGQAETAIKDALNATGDAGVTAQASCGLSITGGQCSVDAMAEASCEGGCTGAVMCKPPSITASCDPGQLSGQCSGSCMGGATCEGSVSASAQCQGSCSADCSGECDVTTTAPHIDCTGTCMGNCSGTCDGVATTGGASGAKCTGMCKGQCDAACMITPGTATAHCNGSCKGSCTGNCKLDANAMVSCGAMVSCKGGCTVAVTAPKCEGSITPPMCGASANCTASCKSSASVQASCTPPSVALQCDASASSNLATLITTVDKNMPAIIAALEVQGPLLVSAAGDLVTTGKAVVGNAANLTGKALACATSAGSAAVSASASINVSVMASASVSGSAGGPAS